MNFFIKTISFIGLFSFSIILKSQTIPSSISGLTLWLTGDSIQLSTPPYINKIFDLSSSLNHALQADTSMQPVITSTPLNGHKAVRFNGINNFLNFNTISDIRTIFWVIREDSNATLNYRALLGSSTVYDFYRSSNSLWDGTFTSSFILNGETRINSNIINGLTTPMPNNYSIISVITTGNVQADNFSNDRNLSRIWDGELAELIIYNQALSTSEVIQIETYLNNKYAPPIKLPNDIIVTYSLCDTIITPINPENNMYSYQWSNGANTSSISTNSSGEYWVAATNIFGFTSFDTINVVFPTPSYPFNNFLCLGTTKTWNTNLTTSTYSFEWNDATTDSLLSISEPGDYWVKVTDTLGCFQYSDTISIAVDSFPTQTTLGMDKTVCQGANLGLETASNAISYLWNTSDTLPQITIDTAGTYWVEIINNNGCIARDTINIAINGIAPTISFSSINACNNSPALFNNTSFTTDGSNIIRSFWTFGTGDTSNLLNPSYSYLTDGNYNVTLQIETDSGCTNMLTQQIQVHKKPTAGFFPTNSLMCSKQNVAFTNNSFSTDGIINSWMWDFGTIGSADTSSLQNGVYTYNGAGNYSVQLIVTSQYNCRDTISQLINIRQSPTANFSVQDSCVNNQLKFTNLTTGTNTIYNWNFGDGSSSSLINPNYTYTSAGQFLVTFSVKSNNNCWDTLFRTITIHEKPIAKFTPVDFCVNSPAQLIDSSVSSSGTLNYWFWDVINHPFQSSLQHPSFTFNNADTGLYQLKLNVQNSMGCKDSVIKTIGVYPLPVTNFSFTPEIGLPPLFVTFNNNSIGGNTYFWDFGDGTTSTNSSPTHTFIDSTIFNVNLTSISLYGCIDSISKQVQVIEPILDVALKNLYIEFIPGSNYMKVTVEIENVGLIPISAIDIVLTNSSTESIIEKWNGNLLPNTRTLHVFSSSIYVPSGEIPDLVCSKAILINNILDANSTNNEVCRAIKKFELINLYPNPTTNDLFLEFISPEPSNTEISIVDNSGKLVTNLFKGISQKGINRMTFLMSIYGEGMYILELKNEETVIRKKFVIN